jgi:hypothetical protein
MTCGDRSITIFAALIGFLIPRTDAIAPASRVRPSMIEASVSTTPAWLAIAPLPALNSPESSSA